MVSMRSLLLKNLSELMPELKESEQYQLHKTFGSMDGGTSSVRRWNDMLTDTEVD